MTPEQQRIAIAGSCGWKLTYPNETANWRSPIGQAGFLSPPNYPSDLNAMHAVLQSQTQAFRAEFDRLLHALAEEKHLLITELTAQDWAITFIKVYESN